ncbi:MAG: hypothetical protein SNJ82_02900 [Gemmataceae bacterium]
MRWILLLVLVYHFVSLQAADPDPEPELDSSNADPLVKRLDGLAAKLDPEAFAKSRDLLVKRMQLQAERLAKAGKESAARHLTDRAALIASLEKDKRFAFNPKTKLADHLDKASVKGKYRQLLRVIHVPGDQAGYTDYRDYGFWSGNAYAGYVDLPSGHWVYMHPHWYIWKEVAP